MEPRMTFAAREPPDQGRPRMEPCMASSMPNDPELSPRPAVAKQAVAAREGKRVLG